MKKMLAIVMTFAVLFGIFSVAFAAENGAVDSVESVQEAPEGYTAIRTAEDFNNIRNDLAGKYILMNDIDLSVYENWAPIGDAENPFTGELDGNGYMIKNLTIVTECNSENNYIGLFGYASANIKNLIVLDANIKAVYVGEELAKGYVGIVAGFNPNFSDVAVTGSVYTESFPYSYVGGICGSEGFGGNIKNCSNYAEVSLIANSLSKVIYVGGICGEIEMLYPDSCCNFGDISVFGENISQHSEVYIGGIFGKTIADYFADELYNSYNRGTVSVDFSTSETCIGGIIGESYSTENIYSTGTVVCPKNSGVYAGALAGNIFDSVLSMGVSAYMINGYYIENTLYPAFDGKSVPNNLTKAPFDNVKFLTEEEFKKQESFEGFDFDEVWAMEENGYPVLQNQPIINVKEDVELEIGDTFELPDYESVKSADESIAKANENKLVALSAGTTTVTLTHAYGYYTEYTVTVAEEETTTEPTTEETTTEKVEISTTIPAPSTTEKEETTQSTTAPVTEPETQPSTVPESTTEPVTEPTTAPEETTTEPADDKKCPLEDCWLIKFLKQFFNFVCEIFRDILARAV